MTAATLIAELGQDGHAHTFGGNEWSLVVPGGASPAPSLILTVDTTDERLGLTWSHAQLPLVSRLDSGIPLRQSYIVDHDARTVFFEGPTWHVNEDEGSDLPRPLPRRSLRLRSLKAGEDLSRAGSKYDVQDTFIGGSGFLRIGGEPLWLLDPERVECRCGRDTAFLASVGYENHAQPSGIVAPGVAFFIGELALYFFGCATCSRVVAVLQPT